MKWSNSLTPLWVVGVCISVFAIFELMYPHRSVAWLELLRDKLVVVRIIYGTLFFLIMYLHLYDSSVVNFSLSRVIRIQSNSVVGYRYDMDSLILRNDGSSVEFPVVHSIDLIIEAVVSHSNFSDCIINCTVRSGKWENAL